MVSLMLEINLVDFMLYRHWYLQRDSESLAYIHVRVCVCVAGCSVSVALTMAKKFHVEAGRLLASL